MNFLVIEDNENLNKLICEAVSSLGEVERAFDGERGFYLAQNKTYDFIILDILLPKINGYEVLKKIRKTCNTPVILITSIETVSHSYINLNIGEDDFILKPLNKKELLLRIDSVLKRSRGNVGASKYSLDNLEINFINKTVKVNGQIVNISGKLYEVLEHLIRNKDIIIPKEQLFNRVWGVDSNTIYTSTEVYISNLRKFLINNNIKAKIKTIKNSGYLWTENN